MPPRVAVRSAHASTTVRARFGLRPGERPVVIGGEADHLAAAVGRPPGHAARFEGTGRGEVPLRKIRVRALRYRVRRPVPRAAEGGKAVLEHDHVVVGGRDLGRPCPAGTGRGGTRRAAGGTCGPGARPRSPPTRRAARPSAGRRRARRPAPASGPAASCPAPPRGPGRGLIEVDDLPAVGEGAAALPYPRAHGTHTLSGPARLAHRIPPGSGPKPRAWPGIGRVLAAQGKGSPPGGQPPGQGDCQVAAPRPRQERSAAGLPAHRAKPRSRRLLR